MYNCLHMYTVVLLNDLHNNTRSSSYRVELIRVAAIIHVLAHARPWGPRFVLHFTVNL